ncbi:restriction endonuclease subunit S [Photobacterium damselae]|uniref:restriction endonuclease subunit S n=1 Tax=Photobacterium damselae TaxID=38293 RepID=UPI004068B8B7
MIKKMPKYESYKDSCEQWIGDIPAHWEVYRLKSAVYECSNGIWGSDPNGRDEIVVLRVADFDDHKLKISDEKLTYRSIPAKERQGRLLKNGDLLIEKSGGGDKTLVGRVVLFDKQYPAVTSNFVAKMTPKEWVISGFLKYVFSALYNNGVNYLSIKQTTGIQNLDASSYLNEKFCIPQKEEQYEIAKFLDNKTTQINEAIAIKQKQIELLKERKQIIIQQAVTQGLNPNVPKKSSGVDWIGEIPEHWGIVRFKNLFTQSRLPVRKGDGVVTSYRDGQVTLRSNRRVGGYTEAILEGGYQGIRKGQLVLNSMDAFEGAIGVSDSDGKCTPEYVICDPINSVNVSQYYFAYLLREMALAKYIQVICNAVRQRAVRIRYSNLAPLFMVVPPIKEQEDIVSFIEKESAKLDAGIKHLNEQISKLKEYKTTLINSAVTGKIKVTELA